MYKISICTVCMNRLYHLQETLPVNIKENQDYPNIEFVILNYNSKDGLEQWVKTEMAEHIQSGRLQYFRTYDPESFFFAHSKNMALRLGTGEIRCLVDADNYAGAGYAVWLAEVFNYYGQSAVVTTLEKNAVPYRDQGGKLAVHADSLYLVNGFDESLIGYGIEDVDMVNRLIKGGGKRVSINDEVFLRFIAHSPEQRVQNHPMSKNLALLFFNITGNMNKQNRVIYAMKDLSFLDVTFTVDSSLKTQVFVSHGGWVIKNSLRGNYRLAGSGFYLTYEDGSCVECRLESNGTLRSVQTAEKTLWKKIEEKDKMFIQLQLAYSECINRAKYVENDRKDYDSVNLDGWGKGRVFHNFDLTTPIDLS